MEITMTESCPKCGKQPLLCLCSFVSPTETSVHILILQHPQEPDKELGTARLTHTILPNSTLRIGLSWSNLSKALGRPGENVKWGTLYLGGRSQTTPGSSNDVQPFRLQIKPKGKKGSSGLEPYVPGHSPELEGIIVLDGTWSQAKTLWWRNPWLLKLHRLVLNPQRRSMYGQLRREPRRECLSTIESVAEALEALGETGDAPQKLRACFGELLKRYRGLDQGASRQPE